MLDQHVGLDDRLAAANTFCRRFGVGPGDGATVKLDVAVDTMDNRYVM